MPFLTYVPRSPLANFVELFWYCDGYALKHSKERVLPDGLAQLVIGLHDGPLRTFDIHDPGRTQSFKGSLLCGPRSKCSIIDTASLGPSMGVQFRAGGAFPFLGVPAGDLHNLNVSLEALWGEKAEELHGRLMEARTPAARFQILEESLLARAQAGPERHPAVRQALSEFQAATPGQTVADVIRRTGFSAKWLVTLFTDQVGMTPKLYCRLRRFQNALSLIGSVPAPDWSESALASGYYDQAHFNRDFSDFAGLNPTQYLRTRSEHPNHVRVAD